MLTGQEFMCQLNENLNNILWETNLEFLSPELEGFDQIIDLLSNLTKHEDKRIKPSDALLHEWFKDIEDECDKGLEEPEV